MFALPSVASAGVWHAEPSTAETPFTTTTSSSNLVFHNILIEKNTPGLEITGTGASTQFAHYTCASGLVTINVTGAVIGSVQGYLGSAGLSPGAVSRTTLRR